LMWIPGIRPVKVPARRPSRRGSSGSIYFKRDSFDIMIWGWFL
jgi:hypothetical protein